MTRATPEASTNASALRRLKAAAQQWQKPAVVVTNLDVFVGLQTARLMRRHGVPVVGLASSVRRPLARTRSVEAVFEIGGDGSGMVEVLHEIAPFFPTRPVLIPCNDDAVAAVSADRERLDYHISLPDHDVIELLTDKGRFLAHAEEMGVSVSPFRSMASREDAEVASEQLRYPVVVKPFRSTEVFRQRVGQKAVRVFDSGRLLEVWDQAAPDYPVMAQEWVEGGDDHLYSFNGYFDADGQPLATFIARKVRQWPPHTGVSSLGVECRNDEVLETALRLFASVPYRGFAYLEMKRDSRTGQHFVLEANIGRPTGRSPIAEAGGVELHYSAYCDALGLPLPQARMQRYDGAKWIYLARDIASAMYYMRRGELSVRQWWQSVRGVRADAVFSWRDPVPFFLDAAAGLGHQFRRGPLD